MKERPYRIGLAMLLVVSTTATITIPFIATSTGCATVAGDPVATNAARAFQARVAYNSALKAANARAPRMSLEQAEQFERVRQSAKRLLTSWDEAVAAGRPFSGSDSLVSILAELALLVEENPQ